MKPRITLLTLGVDDLERSLKFYRDGVAPTRATSAESSTRRGGAFFDLQAGLKLACWPRADLRPHRLSIDASAPPN